MSNPLKDAFDSERPDGSDLIYGYKLVMTMEDDSGPIKIGRQCLAQRNPYTLTWDVSLIETPENDAAKAIMRKPIATQLEDARGLGFYGAIEAMEHYAGSIVIKHEGQERRLSLALGQEPTEDINGNLCEIVDLPEAFKPLHYRAHPNMDKQPAALMAEEQFIQGVADALGSGAVELHIHEPIEKPEGPQLD